MRVVLLILLSTLLGPVYGVGRSCPYTDKLQSQCPLLKDRYCTNAAYAGWMSVNCGKTCNCIDIDGGWTEWDLCSKTCGGGLKRRTCTKPTPEYHGTYCIGDSLSECNEGIQCVTTVASKTTDEPATTSQGCSDQMINITNITTNIRSPGYADNKNYSANSACQWTLIAPPGEKVSFSILSIDTEYGYDIVKIFDGHEAKAKILLTTSGSKTKENIISSKEMMRVSFTSDGSNNMKGFQATAVAVNKTDLPQFSWIDKSKHKLNITFPNATKANHQIIQLKIVPGMEPACIYQGSNSTTSVTISSSSSSSSCQSLDQHVEILISSEYLQQKEAIYSIKNGQLKDITEDIFVNNAFIKRNMRRRIKRATYKPAPAHIEITIQFAYEKSIFEQFTAHGSGGDQIKKQLKQLFSFAKAIIKKQTMATQIELLFSEEIMFINEKFKVTNSNLTHVRKYQRDERIPLIIICTDDYESDTKGLTFRSGACREDYERYGVALVAWREESVVAAEVLAHEILHLVGMDHGKGKVDNDLIDSWYAESGQRCFDKSCSPPPSKQHGIWSCDANSKTCEMKCNKGFASVFSTIKCENGIWSESFHEVGCSPSVFLIAGGRGAENNIEIYHPNITNPTCSYSLPSLEHRWDGHVTFTHHGTIYLCGGIRTSSNCISINSQGANWRTHTMSTSIEGHSAVILRDTLYFIGGFSPSPIAYTEVMSTTLPLTDKPKFTLVPNLQFRGLGCVVKIDEDSFVITGGLSNEQVSTVTKYQAKTQTTMELSSLKPARDDHGCVIVKEDGNQWIVVAGGHHLKTTEKLNLSGGGTIAQWKSLGDLKVEREGQIMMIVTERGIMAMGGFWEPKTVELLDWKTEQWQMVEPSLTTGRYTFGGAVELPASSLNCQLNIETKCLTPPAKQNGNWSCSAGYATCVLTCNTGFISLYTTTTCNEGIWKEINRIVCLPSVFLIAGGSGAANNVEIYHPTIGNPTCSNLPSSTLDNNWKRHSTFTHRGTVYLFGGSFTIYNCISINSQLTDWRRHDIVLSPRSGHSTVILQDTLYLIGGFGGSHGNDYTEAEFTTLPLTDKPEFKPVPNLTYKGSYPCVAKIDEDSFVITGGVLGINIARVTKYHIKDKTSTELSQLQPGRNRHGCVMVEEEGRKWLILTGGTYRYINESMHTTLKTTERMDVSESGKWESLGELKEARNGHQMISTERGIMVIGGRPDAYPGFRKLKTVELLIWETKEWDLVEPSLATGRTEFGGAVEIPASLFGCETEPIIIAACDGEYLYNQEYKDGNVETVPDGQTCHSLCESKENCKTWTWTQENKCRIQTFVSAKESKTGSISGLKTACKPKCYLVIGEQEEATTNTQFCNGTNLETSCYDIIHMEPFDFKEENDILVCHEAPESSGCEPTSYGTVSVVCNAEPTIVTNTIYSLLGKRRYSRDNWGWGRWGR